jgi:putative Mg2+ transporter-C (MgtC) family protein
MTIAMAEFARHIVAALIAGAIIGTERSYHGRPAGFRTHALVCMASSMLMTVALVQSQWFVSSDAIRMDPTRMAQGIMTGIGFLGAGVIFKEGLTVRGLTTAASIWTTAAIGILMGVGFYRAGALATVLTLGVLSVFRFIERRFPREVYAQQVLRFAPESVMSEERVRDLMGKSGFSVSSVTYHLAEADQGFEYRLALSTPDRQNMARLAEALKSVPGLRSFTLSPSD